ncbi:efflux RND transporter permease subunit [Sulfuricurvum sp.]|uniref:efflux RND transporter permease subunit n=1 Tax=Sulfuricurvum sp. TaxID=2025608 RepID=UPI003BAFC744
MLRRFLEFALDKPLLNHLFLFFIALVSIFAYINIPKEIFPPMQMDKITINGAYAGTSADVLDKMVVQTLEDDLKNVNELDAVTSTIKNGSFGIIADIKPGSNNNKVLNDVKDIIALTKRDLPADMNEPTAKIHEEVIPLVLIAIAGDVTTEELLARADELKSDLSELKDLSEITIRGDADDELVIRLDDQKIEAYGLSQNGVVSALSNLSSIFPIGTIKEAKNHLYISTYNGEKDPDLIRDTLINVGDAQVRLGDIASISFELSDGSELSHFNGQRNVSLNITKAKSGNAIEIVKKIRKKLEGYDKKYPHLKFEIYTDTSVWIKNRLNTVFSNIVFGLVLVFFAMLIFVNRGIAMVVAMGIPVSFMIGLIATQMIGYSLNMLSLLGALIALGMLVDEAIVVAENIYRHMEEGLSRREATIRGASEMFPAVVAATMTTIFAFLPLLMMSGEMGTFIKILPIMISILLISSLFEAFYFLPLHAHDFLRLRKEDHLSHVIWENLYGWFAKVLKWLLRRPKINLALIVLSILVIEVLFVKHTKFQLFPKFDVTQVYVTGKVDVNNDLEATEAMVAGIEKELIAKLPHGDVSSVTSVIGMRLDSKNKAELGDNLFHIFIDLHEHAPDNFYNRYINPYLSLEYDASGMIRERDADKIGEQVSEILKPYVAQKIADKPMFEELITTVPGTGVIAHDVEIALEGKSDAELVRGIERLKAQMGSIQGVHSIGDNADIGERELKLRVNGYGQQLGLDETLLNAQLRSYYLKAEYSKMFNEKGLIRIRIEGKEKDALSSLENFPIRIGNEDVALKEVCDFIYTRGYVTLNKEDGKRTRSVFASINKDLVTSGDVMNKLAPTVEALKKEGYGVNVKGEEQENAKTKREMSQAAIMAIVLIFITLVWLFDSFVKSLIVLSVIPLSLLGVYAGHWMMGLNMTMPGLIGTVGLVGVVVNDGLLMVQFIQRARDKDELITMAKTRLRPILMTSITTVLGLATLIFFASGQAKILQPMAISLGFGLGWATLLNLIYVPLLYGVIYRIKDKVIEPLEK